MLGGCEWINKMELSKEQRLIGIALLTAAVVLGSWLLVYSPLLAKVKSRSALCTDLESQAAQARNASLTLGKDGKRLVLISESEISTLLNEITGRGKDEGINFVSITPGIPEKPEGSLLKLVPLKLETKSDYKALGVFLGQLQEMGTAFVTVGSLEVGADPTNPGLVLGRVTLNIYLSD